MSEICFTCKCFSERHVIYYPCLINNDIICYDCCISLFEHKTDFTKNFNKTYEEIKQICLTCGRNCIPEEDIKL